MRPIDILAYKQAQQRQERRELAILILPPLTLSDRTLKAPLRKRAVSDDRGTSSRR
jgi:hypothetical protein